MRNSAPLVVSALLVASVAPVRSKTVVAQGDDVVFSLPHASADGSRIALERRPAGLFTEPWSDVVLLDLDPECGQDALRELSFDGKSHEPSVSADGDRVLWWQDLPGSVPAFYLAQAPFDTPPYQVTYDAVAATVSRLEIAPDADVFVYRRTGSARPELMAARVQSFGEGPWVLDSGDDIGLSQNRPLAADGTVFYWKTVGGRTHLFKCLVEWNEPCDPEQLTVTDGAETDVTVSDDGLVHAYVAWEGLDASGPQFLIVVAGGIPRALASSLPQAAPAFRNLGISRDGTVVTFSSNLDLAGSNPDGLEQVYRAPVDGSPIEQLTSLTALGTLTPAVAGVSSDAGGHAIAYAHVPWRSVSGPPWGTVHVATPDALLHVPEPGTQTVTPPFDLVVPSPCAELLGSIGCTARLRNSTEGTRTSLATTTWEFRQGPLLATIVQPPVPSVLGPGETVILAPKVARPPGFDTADVLCRVSVVSGEVEQADVATVEMELR